MSIGRTILDCKLALCHLASDMKYAGAVYEARTYGSVRGMRRRRLTLLAVGSMVGIEILQGTRPSIKVRKT